jgi:hypothetical protein
MFSRQDSSLLDWIIAILIALLVSVLFLKGVIVLRHHFPEGYARQSQVDSSLKEGIVVDKQRTQSYSYLSTVYIGNAPVIIPTYVPGYTSLTIEGEVNGEKVKKTVDVSEEEYHSYEVGDTYKVK